jgi:hypothetical protein
MHYHLPQDEVRREASAPMKFHNRTQTEVNLTVLTKSTLPSYEDP